MTDSIIKRYYDALGEGKLLAKKCDRCGAVSFPPTTACNACGGFEQSWTELSGKGTLLYVSHGMAPPPNPRFNDMAPYAYGHIRLEEGVFVQAIITGMAIDPETLKGFFEAGPVEVAPDILKVQGLNVLAFKQA
jgi:uncharacterized OB-fold protein